MAKFSLSRYDTQARVGLLIAVVALAGLLAQVAIVFNAPRSFQGVDMEQLRIYYGPMRKWFVLGATAATVGVAIIAVGFGYNSAGQRRNDKPGMSWAAFFIGATTISLAVIVFMIFRFRGELVLH